MLRFLFRSMLTPTLVLAFTVAARASSIAGFHGTVYDLPGAVISIAKDTSQHVAVESNIQNHSIEHVSETVGFPSLPSRLRMDMKFSLGGKQWCGE